MISELLLVLRLVLYLLGRAKLHHIMDLSLPRSGARALIKLHGQLASCHIQLLHLLSYLTLHQVREKLGNRLPLEVLPQTLHLHFGRLNEPVQTLSLLNGITQLLLRVEQLLVGLSGVSFAL